MTWAPIKDSFGVGASRRLMARGLKRPTPPGGRKYGYVEPVRALHHRVSTYVYESRQRMLREEVRTLADMSEAEIAALEEQYGCPVRRS